MTLKEKINMAYDLLQRMEIRATKGNVDAVSLTLTVLKEAYNKIPDEQPDGGDENGAD